MSDKQNPLRVVHNVLHHAQKSQDTKHVTVTSSGLADELARLREFQGRRIAHTYRDFTAQPQYAPAMQFFLQDLYGARDYTQRDHDAERIHNFLKKFMPAEMTQLAADAIDLSRLTNHLDNTLSAILVEQLGAPEHLTDDLYAEAYRRSDNYRERRRQIELLVTVMHDSAETARFTLTGPALRMAKGPALAAGWDEMFSFLERGYRAFKPINKAQPLLDAIHERETRIMQRIRANEDEPFNLG